MRTILTCLTAITLVTVASGSPALATQNLTCATANGAAEIDLLVGTLPGLSILRAIYSAGGKDWSTEPAVVPGTMVYLSQGFSNDETIMVDFVDEQYMGTVAELRLFRSQEGEFLVLGGTFRIAGVGAWVVDCGDF